MIRMARLKYFSISVLIWALIVPLMASSISPKQAQELLQTKIDATKKLYQEWEQLLNSNLPKEKKIQQEKTLKKQSKDLLRSILDMEYIVQLALKRHWSKIPKERKDKFKKNFTDIFDSRFVSIKKYDKNAKYNKIKKKGNLFTKINIKSSGYYFDRIFFKKKVPRVRAIIPGKEIDIEIDFLFTEHQGKNIVYDLIIDGNSLVNDYRNQFNRMIRQHGIRHFLDIIDRKTAKMLKKND